MDRRPTPPSRITIRLSPTLAAKLAATVGPRANLAAVVRLALEAYLGHEEPAWQPALPQASAMAANIPALADTLAAIETRLGVLEQRLSALEAMAASGRRWQPARQPPQSKQGPPSPDLDHAYTRMQALQGEGYTLAQIAAQLDVEGFRTKRGKPWHKSSVAYVLKTH